MCDDFVGSAASNKWRTFARPRATPLSLPAFGRVPVCQDCPGSGIDANHLIRGGVVVRRIGKARKSYSSSAVGMSTNSIDGRMDSILLSRAVRAAFPFNGQPN